MPCSSRASRETTASRAAIELSRTSTIPATAERVWARAVTPEGINHELGPWIKMTVPRSLRGKTIEDVEAGQRVGRSWLLVLGLIPFDYDDLGLAEVGPGSGSWSARRC